ncbi:MAG: hypothetical protein GTN78_24585, partial [Gemmatimonadales bacterium]|nr:hypothetical protein [Gemmatimonadales bacterium]NIN12105.1 hypothetical protein [Gemmatimonadales bacterium]NIR03340.1 hypothetical protein [Gemmatimonadales bacterium]NIS67020.1 hypothetical protein [Gemmatimonadales bacterium]
LCYSTMERFVWDGDQVLYELRYPGGDDLSPAALDWKPPRSASPYVQHGTVGYSHGPGIDRPLDLIRQDYYGADLTLLPHVNWRGHFDFGTDTVGYQTTADVDWPAPYRRTYHDETVYRRPPEWYGSLVQDKKDGTGLMYMRNRYYDPQTGQFTQEDPIGLAGGMNLYGFADGDPINFSDPFGLLADTVKFEGDDRAALETACVRLSGEHNRCRSRGTRPPDGRRRWCVRRCW